MAKDVNLWLKMVCEGNVEVLELHQPYNAYIRRRDQCYILLTSVFKAKSLTKLVLRGKIGVHLTFINHLVNFSFKVLSLEGVCFETEQQMQNLISRCSLIEYITLDECCVYSTSETHLDYIRNSSIKSLSLHGLPRLKSVDVRGIEELHVDVLCLENFRYSYPYAPCKIDFDRCKNLRRLYLVYSEDTIITEKWFHELFQKFSILESLELSNCKMPRRINISSDRLKVLVLSPCARIKSLSLHGLLSRLKSVDVRGIEEVNVDVSCLENFRYSFPYLHAPCKIDFNRCKNLRRLHLVDTIITEQWFHELFQKFPILESLELSNCKMPRRINISSDRLKVLVLSPCSKLNELQLQIYYHAYLWASEVML